ncbi:glycosyltransferase family 4 protein [Ramlibacter henchirensis]|uniref:Glycosyltransferase family 4 protein n=2 Tax=Ramlibacter henchirensis TaxID=204072 RepID=A0A4Z0C7A9_9BURK|nr:glycosyltransferase family 4 protein [Ramlibacter henchirensis]
MLACLPQAPLFATIDFLAPQDRARLGPRDIHTTFLQRAPGVRKRFWNYLPVTALAVETHDVRAAQLIVSSSHAFAKGVLTTAEQLHVSYVHSPMRYAWDLHHEYLADYRLDRGAKGLLARYMFHRLRQWDRQTAHNVDLFLANSQHVARRIWRAYRRPAKVLHPPVAIGRFAFEPRKGDHYVTVSRLVSYKRIDLLLEAFRRMPQRKLVVIGDGPEAPRLRAMCPPNVQMLGYQPDAVVQQHLGSARAFLFAAHEDFGISPIEAQACGTPVIAYGVGGSRETVRDLRSVTSPTGLLFDDQTPESVAAAVEAFDAASIDPHACREWAERFDERHFREGFALLLDQAWSAWSRAPDSVEPALFSTR